MKAIKIVAVLFIALATASCNFDISLGQTDGDGNVVTEERPATEAFDQVKGSAGIDVFLSEGTEQKIVVEADENLHDIITTEITNGKLSVGVVNGKNIGRSKAKKVHITYVSLTAIAASSGADVIANSVVRNERVSLDASSGADLEAEVFAKEVYAETSSGADLKVSGKASKLIADASSGSDLNAKNLLVLTCNAEASSGADITVHVKDELRTDASSGGDINYYGDPTAVTNTSSRSGGVHKM
ncbi:head GIN domain-containing protein [Altibacter lentus]|uniref:head GIN domain-containing protein n=1 Tax=Altibacter lentus TaxID=1223410 RepID=UPI000550F3D7|nr:head GIN domain-containing protein [Altibacter lentus]